MRPIFLARPASFTSEFLSCVSSRSAAFPLCPARLAPRRCISAPPVKGVLRLVTDARKSFFCEKALFLRFSHFANENSVLASENFLRGGRNVNFFRRSGRFSGVLPPISCGIRRLTPKSRRVTLQITPESLRDSRRAGRVTGASRPKRASYSPTGLRSARKNLCDSRIRRSNPCDSLFPSARNARRRRVTPSVFCAPWEV